MISAWTADLAYYAHHGVSSRRVQELDFSLRGICSLCSVEQSYLGASVYAALPPRPESR
jgi:hypothetical protein